MKTSQTASTLKAGDLRLALPTVGLGSPHSNCGKIKGAYKTVLFFDWHKYTQLWQQNTAKRKRRKKKWHFDFGNFKRLKKGGGGLVWFHFGPKSEEVQPASELFPGELEWLAVRSMGENRQHKQQA